MTSDQHGWKPRTTDSYRKNFAPFLSWCRSTGLLSVDPLLCIPKPLITERLPDFYTDDELAAMMYHIEVHSRTHFERARNRAMLAVLLLAGLRRGELLGLRIADVDFEEEVMRIRPETSKSRRPRVIPMNSRLAEILREYWHARTARKFHATWFWLSSTTGDRFTADGLRSATKLLSRKLGFVVRLHKMRHTFATRFYQGSRDIVSLQTILGHRRITTTMIYTHVLPEQTRPVLEQNPITSIL